MFKRVIVLLIALLLALPLSVKADTYPKETKEWTVTFDGKKLKTNYTSREVADAMAGMQPGDNAELKITLINEHTESSTWWMENKIIKSFEDKLNISGGAYKYSLSFTDASGTETVLYSSEKVGGTGSKTGLHEATDALENFFILGDIESGESAVVTVRFELDGETQGNVYQDTIGELQLDFAVEVPDSPEIFRIPKTGLEGGPNAIRTRNLYYLACGILFIIMMILAVYLYLDSRRRRTH